MYILSLSETSISTIRGTSRTKYRITDKDLISDGYINTDVYHPFFVRFNKTIEVVYEAYYSYNSIKGNYKKIISEYLGELFNGNELDLYLISKEEWDKAVEKTYKNYNEIIEL